jgi:hypothetical protein
VELTAGRQMLPALVADHTQPAIGRDLLQIADQRALLIEVLDHGLDHLR